jgi:hypothetical protein
LGGYATAYHRLYGPETSAMVRTDPDDQAHQLAFLSNVLGVVLDRDQLVIGGMGFARGALLRFDGALMAQGAFATAVGNPSPRD